MPRMPKYLKREWAFFLDERGRKKYNSFAGNVKEVASRVSVPPVYLSGAEFFAVSC